RIRDSVSVAGIDVQLGRNAETLERHEQLFGLWTRNARISFHDVNHCRSFRVLDVLERRLIPVRVEVVVRQLVSEVKLAVSLYVALCVHRDPVRRTCASADRLEAIGMCKNPVRPGTASTPAEYSLCRAVDDALSDQVVDTSHDVFVTLLEI